MHLLLWEVWFSSFHFSSETGNYAKNMIILSRLGVVVLQILH